MINIDLHNHLIFGVDDGPGSPELSLLMLEEAKKQKIDLIVATSHYGKGFDQTYLDLKERIDYLQEKTEIKLVIGLEVYVSHDLIELIDNEQIFTINGSQYMLLELPNNITPRIYNIISDLEYYNITPLIAHPERNISIQKDLSVINRLIDLGCRFQMNIPSLLGAYDKATQEVAKLLLKENVYSCIGSDAHNCTSRNFCFKEGANLLTDEQLQLFMENNSKVIRNEKLEKIYFNLNKKDKLIYSVRKLYFNNNT